MKLGTIVAVIILIWANVTKGPKRIWQSYIHTADDAWTKGWEFEAQCLLRYVLTIASGVFLAGSLHPSAWDEMLSAKYPSLVVTIGVLIFIPALFVLARRNAIYNSRKRRGGRRRPMSLGYTLADKKGKIKLRRLPKEE